MTAFDARVAVALAAENPYTSLRDVIQDESNDRVPPTVLLERLETARAGLSDADEDVVLEVMDLLVGWFSPDQRLADRPR